MSIKRVWNVQFGTANEINGILSQIMQRFDELDAELASLGTALDTLNIRWLFDWEKDYYRSNL